MLIYFLGCLHNDPFHGESALKLVSRIPSGAKGVRFVGLENSEANHALMVSWRPQLRDELQHTLPWLPTPLLNGFVASLSWEPDFAKNLWSGVALTWMDERPIDIRCVESKVVAIKTLLSRAGVTEGQDLKEAIHRVQRQLRAESEDIAVNGLNLLETRAPGYFDRDTNMFEKLKLSVADAGPTASAVVIVGPKHMVEDERTLIGECLRARYPSSRIWFHEACS